MTRLISFIVCKTIDQDSKQVAREAWETIHIIINNPALKHNTGKMYIPGIFIDLLGTDSSLSKSNLMVDSDLSQGHTHLTIPSNKFSRAVDSAN